MTADGNPNQVLARQVIGLLEDDLGREGFALLDVRVFKGGGRLQVRIYVDLQQGGITLDDVTRASRSAGMLLEEAELIPGRYVIEVSSPGIRRPLRTAEHFRAVIGQKVDLKILQDGSPRRLRGVLLGLEGEDALVFAPVARAAAPQGQIEDDPDGPDEPDGPDGLDALEAVAGPQGSDPASPRVHDGGPLVLSLEQVLEANLDPEFDAQALIHADRQRRKQEKREERQARAKPRKSRPRKRDGRGSADPE